MNYTKKILIPLLVMILIYSTVISAAQANEDASDLFMKRIIYKDDVNLTAYKIITDLYDNIIIIYGNKSKEGDGYGIGADDIYIVKLDPEGNIIWEKYFCSNYWSFGIYDIQVDSQNNIHIISYHHGWCGNEIPTFEYTKLSSDGEELLYKYFTGSFIQMTFFGDRSVGILNIFPYSQLWSYPEDLEGNNIGKMNFVRISEEIDISISMNVTFFPRGFLIENTDSIIIISNSTWRLSMSGDLSYISKLSERLSVSSQPIVKDKFFVFKEYNSIKIIKISNDYQRLEVDRILLTFDFYIGYNTTVKFDRVGNISIMQWENGTIKCYQIEPESNLIASAIINTSGEILIDNTHILNNSNLLLLIDGNMDDYRVEGAKNIYIASSDIHFQYDFTGDRKIHKIPLFESILILIAISVIIIVFFKKRHNSRI